MTIDRGLLELPRLRPRYATHDEEADLAVIAMVDAIEAASTARQ